MAYKEKNFKTNKQTKIFIGQILSGGRASRLSEIEKRKVGDKIPQLLAKSCKHDEFGDNIKNKKYYFFF